MKNFVFEVDRPWNVIDPSEHEGVRKSLQEWAKGVEM
jgi:hypothetical protein